MIKSALQSSLTNDIKYNSMSVGNLPSNEYLIQSHVLDAATAVIEFNVTGLGSQFRHLQLVTSVRTNRSDADSDPVRIRFNSDTGSNYARHRLIAYLSTNLISGAATSQNAMFITESAACANNAANIFAGVVTDILDPFQTNKNKTIRSFGGNHASGWNAVELYSGFWNNTNAVTTITLTPLIGTNFVAGSRFSLYGVTA
jgi:hypothetical protein